MSMFISLVSGCHVKKLRLDSWMTPRWRSHTTATTPGTETRHLHPTLLKLQYCEPVHGCCFKSLNFRMVCCMVIDHWTLRKPKTLCFGLSADDVRMRCNIWFLHVPEDCLRDTCCLWLILLCKILVSFPPLHVAWKSSCCGIWPH